YCRYIPIVNELAVATSLYQARGGKLLHMVGDCGLLHRQLGTQQMARDLAVGSDDLQDPEPARVSQRLGHPAELLCGERGVRNSRRLPTDRRAGVAGSVRTRRRELNLPRRGPNGCKGHTGFSCLFAFVTQMNR